MTRRLEPEDLYSIKLVEDPRISPDGSQVAFVLMEIDREAYEYRRAIWMASTGAGTPPRRFSGGGNDTSPRWSPDGRWLAFVRSPAGEVKPKDERERDRGVGKGQVWVMPSDGGEGRQLTFLRDGAGDPVWAPDGESLVFVAETGSPDDPEAEDATLHDRRVPRVRTIDRLFHRLDGKGWIYERRTHLFSIGRDGGDPVQLTDGDWDDEMPAFSPDGRQLAFTSGRMEDRWTWLGADVYTLDLRTRALRRLTDERWFCYAPAFSPDGKRIAFTAEKRRDYDGYSDLFVVPAAGGKAQPLTRDFGPTFADSALDDLRAGHGVAHPVWSADGEDVYLVASGRGSTHLYAVPAEGGTPRAVTSGERRVYEVSADAARRIFAFASSDPSTPGDLFVQPVDGPARRLTELNADLLKEVTLAHPSRIAFRGADGWGLEGWVMHPGDGDAGSLRPAILEVHGGPEAMYGWSFFLEFQLLCSRGYTVVYTNPRGSTGYGRAFSEAVNRDWGGKDYQDVLAGLDAAIAAGGIDPDRLGIAGGSYGGYMTNWAVGHTDRFKAAATMRCVANFASHFGTGDLGWYLTVESMGGLLPWKDLDELMARSPISYVENIKTPLLILHSDNDLRCPVSEAEQMYAALKYLGREVKYLRFEGQTHDLSRNGHPRSRVIRLHALLDWFTSHIDVAASREEAASGAASSRYAEGGG